MLVALIAVSCIAVLLLALVAHLATRPSPAERRERLLERDNLRLSRDLEVAHDRLMYVVGRQWSTTPAEHDLFAAERARYDDPDEPDDEDDQPILSHDELADDLLLVPDLPDAYAGAM